MDITGKGVYNDFILLVTVREFFLLVLPMLQFFLSSINWSLFQQTRLLSDPKTMYAVVSVYTYKTIFSSASHSKENIKTFILLGIRNFRRANTTYPDTVFPLGTGILSSSTKS